MKATSLLDLRSDSCRYIAGEPNGLETLYCGQERAHRKTSYCPEHHALCYVGLQVKRQVIRSEKEMSQTAAICSPKTPMISREVIRRLATYV